MDLVSDALVRIKNGYLAQRGEVRLPYSKLIGFICELLKKEGYIESYKEVNREDSATVKEFRVILKYQNQVGSSKRTPAVTDVKRVSKPGLRVYKSKSGLPHVLNGLGIAIVSTPKGVMSDREARKAGLGGEVLAIIW